jgi:glycogen debranching enzyme
MMQRKVSPPRIVMIAREKAVQILERCMSSMGLKASALSDGYPQVWARDSMISFLCAKAIRQHADLVLAFKRTLETLRSHQNPLGGIPNNVDTRTGKMLTYNSGAIDAHPWFIIGVWNYYDLTRERKFLTSFFPSVKKTLLWLRYQDSNGCGLVEHPEAATWADLLANRFNSLYANVLYCEALAAAARIADVVGRQREAKEYRARASDVSRKINLLFWVTPETSPDSLRAMHGEWELVYKQMVATLLSKPYYVPYISFRDFADYCDTLGNCLAVLFDVAPRERAQQILKFLQAVGIADPYPAKALYPPIYPGDKEWREYYKFGNLNYPNQYHNGGIWGMVGGFYVAALAKAGFREEAALGLVRLAEANRQGRFGEWEFNEWLHGITGRPMGAPKQAWSAGMYLYAYDAVYGN